MHPDFRHRRQCSCISKNMECLSSIHSILLHEGFHCICMSTSINMNSNTILCFLQNPCDWVPRVQDPSSHNRPGPRGHRNFSPGGSSGRGPGHRQGPLPYALGSSHAVALDGQVGFVDELPLSCCWLAGSVIHSRTVSNQVSCGCCSEIASRLDGFGCTLYSLCL